MDRIDTMQAFVAVAQEGSFTGAGRRLGMSTKLVSKYVQHLEAQLRTQLFNRTTRSVSLTDVGATYLERCRPLLEEFDELEDLVRERHGALAGPIRLTAPTGFGSTHLSRALVPFLEANPDVELDLRLSDQRIDLVEEGIDLAIRIGTLRDSSLVARKLTDMPMILSASPDYLERRGQPSTPQDLTGHTCLMDSNQVEQSIWRFRKDGKDWKIRLRSNVSTNSPMALCQLAIGGLGIIRCPRYTVREALNTGVLQQVLPDFASDMYGIYALYPPNRHLARRVRALIDHLAVELSD
ncbi:LysR family transcriptional regulator [Rhodobacterales bacterium]|nr:LysR family transcriptional regulator [Rhodobacterales bacterium]